MAIPAAKMTAERSPFLAVVSDEVTRAALVRVVTEKGWMENQVLEGSVADAIAALSHVQTPERLVVDLSGSNDPLADIEALSRVCESDTRVVVLGDVNDVKLYRQLMDMGVQDYFPKPVSSEELNESLSRVDPVEAQPAEEPEKTGRLIAVIGSRGGVGASTVAANIAWVAAHEQGKRVALVDLDLYFGTLALALDMEPGRGFREALEHPSRIDGLFIERAMVRESGNLFVLAAEEELENRFSFDPDALKLLLKTLRADFDCIVIDLPRFAARSQVATMVPLDTCVVVSDPTLAGMRDTLRLKKMLQTVTSDSDLKFVINRVGLGKNGELSIKDFEGGAELFVSHAVPLDVKTAIAAEGAGKTVADIGKSSKMAKVLGDLAQQVSGDENVAAEAPLWKRLLGRG